jgi:hypothetical protein
MKKVLSLLILISIYLLALAAGFIYGKTSGANPDPDRTPLPQQSNWVLVRVDDMTVEAPQLVSVWVMLSSLSSGPQVYFKPIFSTEWNNTRNSQLAKKFSVNPNRTLSAQFLDELNRINIPRSGLVILDNKGFQEFATWFSAPTSNRQTAKIYPALWQTSPTGSESHMLLQTSEAESYQHICTVLQTQNRSHSIILRWSDLVPNHIMLLPNLDPFASLWDQLLSPTTGANCKVIPGS